MDFRGWAAAIVVVASIVAGCSTESRNAPDAPLERLTDDGQGSPAATTPPQTPPRTRPEKPRTTTSTTMTTTVARPGTRAEAPKVDAAAYAVLDAESGELLASHDGDERRPVGSVIKLLTAYVAYEAGKPSKLATAPDRVLVSPEESAIGIYPGEQLPRDVLIRALLIVSGNDAARTLAVDIAGSEKEFARQMTTVAETLGLSNTRAANATGLDADGQHSSANDLVALGAVLMRNPTFRQTVARTDATLHDQTLPATNDWMPTYDGATGIKTGRTTNAGWCILAAAERDGRQLIVAVLGAPTEPARNAGATALLDWAFAR